MTDPDFPRLFDALNARQMQADRDRDTGHIWGWALIAGLALSAVCIAAVVVMGVR